MFCFFFQAEDGIRDLVRSRGLGDVYKRQVLPQAEVTTLIPARPPLSRSSEAICRATLNGSVNPADMVATCLLYTSDAADERSSVERCRRAI